MKKLRLACCFLLTMATVLVYGESAEQILKQELENHLTDMLKQVSSIMEYTNQEALDRAKEHKFDAFYQVVMSDGQTTNEVKKFRSLIENIELPIPITGDTIGLTKLEKFRIALCEEILTKKADYPYFNHLKKQKEEIAGIIKENCFKWEELENNLKQDYKAFIFADSTKEWNTFLVNVKTETYRKEAEQRLKDKEPQEPKANQGLNADGEIQGLATDSLENLQKSKDSISSNPQSEYMGEKRDEQLDKSKSTPKVNPPIQAQNSEQVNPGTSAVEERTNVSSQQNEKPTEETDIKAHDAKNDAADVITTEEAAAEKEKEVETGIVGFTIKMESTTVISNSKSESSSASSKSKFGKEDNDNLYLWIALAVVVVVSATGLLFVYLKKKKKEEVVEVPLTNGEADKGTLPKVPQSTQESQVLEAPKSEPSLNVDKKDQGKPEVDATVVPVPIQGSWVLVGASVRGNGHIESNLPCQDNHKYEELGNGWGIAIVSDGAGSAAHSDMGSKIVVERGLVHFKKLIQQEGWMDKNTLPSDAEWLSKSYSILRTMRDEVDLVAKKNNVAIKELSATCLVIIFSPIGLLTVHVGDGRMGCKPVNGAWKTIMTPHKGEEANQTIFLVSDFWGTPNYVQSGILVPESIVVREPVEAFALMSDGCEATAWLCTAQNPETGMYYDKNQPFEGFFNPVIETLKSFDEDQVPVEERNAKWYKFIESGMKSFVREQDDKTMIVGVLVEKNE